MAKILSKIFGSRLSEKGSVLKVYFSDKFYNKCPECGKTLEMKCYVDFEYQGDGVFVAFCKKDLVLFVTQNKKKKYAQANKESRAAQIKAENKGVEEKT